MLHIYHPNKSNSGFACSFWYSDREHCIFAKIVKQAGWDDKSGNGTFKASLDNPEKNVSIKLSDMEAGAILDCIERNRPFSSFHDNEETPKSISFVPWMGKAAGGVDEDPKPVQRGFSFSVLVTKKTDKEFKNPFFIGLTLAEARIIREFLVFCMHRRFEALVSKTRQFPLKKTTEPNPEPASEVPPLQEPPAEEVQPVKKDDDIF